MESTAVYQGEVYVGMDNLSFEFIQVAAGNRRSLSVGISDADWLRLFEFCKSRDILGIGYT